MSRRTVVLIVAILLAGAAAFAVYTYQATVADNIRGDIAEVTVWRATAPIEGGTEGTEARGLIAESTALAENLIGAPTVVCLGPVDPGAAGADATVCSDNPKDLNALLDGTVSAGPIAAGQLITTEMFITPAEANVDRLAARIPQGKVAISVSPGEIGSVGGFIEPGDSVNVLTTIDVEVSLGESATGVTIDEGSGDSLGGAEDGRSLSFAVTQTILQDIPVLAVGNATEDDPLGQVGEELLQESEAIVLEVVPTDAEKLELARQRGEISLVLLPANQPVTPVEDLGATIYDILDLVEVVNRLAAELEVIDGLG